jgi:hypothetical protein
MIVLSEAIERNRVRVKYQYPARLPLPRYQAWELLTDAIEHINAHGSVIAPNVREFAESGDYDALVTLMDARRNLCTPVAA